MRAGRFFRNPDRQLRAVGASEPDASLSQNVSSSCSRQPVIVTDATAWGAVVGMGSIAADLATGSAAGVHPLYAVFTGSEAGIVAAGFFSSSAGACCDSVFAAARAFRVLAAGWPFTG
jgi:hypothetical protein